MKEKLNNRHAPDLGRSTIVSTFPMTAKEIVIPGNEMGKLQQNDLRNCSRKIQKHHLFEEKQHGKA